MPSWLLSILQSDGPNPSTSSTPPQDPTPSTPPNQPHSPAAGVKHDLSVLGGAIASHLRSAAAFLAPPPPKEDGCVYSVRHDLAEIGGSFKSSLSLSLFSSNRAALEISRYASNFLPLEEERGLEGYGDVAGVTEEVIEDVRNISTQPQRWTDFPLSSDEDFVLSDSQKQHALAVESLVPDLTALKQKMCCYMSEEQFWMIYFALLSPTLKQQEKGHLITPQIDEARASFLQKLMKNKFSPEDSTPYLSEGDTTSFRRREHSLSWEKDKVFELNEHEIRPKKLEDEQPKKDEDSDLSAGPSKSKPSRSEMVLSRSESNEWVQLAEGSNYEVGEIRDGLGIQEKDSEGEDSYDWLTVDEVDL